MSADGWRSAFVPLAVEPGQAPLSVAVRECGPAAAPAVICVHGLTRNGHDFDALAEALAGPFRVITPDLPGRGDSGWCENASDYNHTLYLDALERVLRQCAVTAVHWIGTSLGAALGMRMAQRYPELVRSLVLNDSGAQVDGAALAALRLGARDRPGFPDPGSARDYLRVRYTEYGIETDAEWTRFGRHALQQEADGLWRLRFDPRVVSDAPIPPVVDQWPLWDAVRCPVLILRGERSRILERETCERMVSGRHDARWIEIPGSGHAPHLAGPSRIGPVAAFLREVSGDETSRQS